jgi:hypothetical protein
MATREIDESEFLASQATIRAVNGMLANPASRKLLLQARKTADPNAVIPEIDAAAPINSTLEEIRAAMAAEKQAAADERAAAKAEREAEKQARAEEKEAEKQAKMIADFEANWTRQKAALRQEGWRDEGIDEIVAHAEKNGIADLEIAAAHWEKLHPPSEPVQPNSTGSWGFMDNIPDDDKFVKAMIASKGEDEGALNAEINSALKDFRSQQAQGSRR